MRKLIAESTSIFFSSISPRFPFNQISNIWNGTCYDNITVTHFPIEYCGSWRPPLWPVFSSRSGSMWISCWTKRYLSAFFSGFFRFPQPQISFHHFSTPISFIWFHLNSSAPVMMKQAWSAGILAIYWPSMKGLRRISSLDPTMCRTPLRRFIHYF